MNKPLLSLAGIALAICFATSVFGQTSGTLTFTFTEASHSTTYEGNAKHALAVWIQTSTGAFVKTKLRYCCNGNTIDHLPTWGANAGASAGNCSSGNKTDATTGATLTSWTTKTITWDGNNVNGTANGTLVADGAYKVTIQSTWDHGTAGTVTTSFPFTKGPTADHQTPTNTVNFTGIKLDWVPAAGTGVSDISVNSDINVYPNPSQGRFNIDYKTASSIRVVNTLGVVVYEEKVEQGIAGTRNIDLSNFANGIYFVNVLNEEESSNFKVLLNK